MEASISRFPKSMEVEAAPRRLRIAVVYSRIPVPMRRADQMTVAHLLSFLQARGHEVDLYSVNTGSRAEEPEMEWLQAHCREVHLYENDPWSIVQGLSKVFLHFIPVQVGLFSNPRQSRELHEGVAEGKYDVVYTYYFRSAEISKGFGRNLPNGSENPYGPATFLALQLSQTLNTRRIAKNAPNLFYRWFYSLESRLVARYESQIWRHFTKTVLIGKSDVREIQSTCEALGRPLINNFCFGAHGTDVRRFAPRTDVLERPNRVVFSGVMRTPTNIQAVQWFVRMVWPAIHREVPDARFAIVGREPSSDVLALGQVAGVEVVGDVPDTSVCIAEASICVNPMQAGGGMQNKLLEYLACGKAIVATSVANEGINANPNEHLLIADDPSIFAQTVTALLRNRPQREQLGRAGRAFVLENWTWEAHFLKLEKDFYEAVGAPLQEKVESGVLT